MIPFASRLVVAALLLASAGCGAASCPNIRFTDADLALGSYRSMRSYAHAVRAEARVERRDAGGRIRGTVYMLFQRPDRVRFDAMTQLGPAAVLTSDGSAFALTDLRENKFYVGQTCPSSIARLLGVRLSGEDVGAILTGESPVLADAERTIECTGGHYLVRLRDDAGRTQELELEVRAADVLADPAEQRMRLRRSEIHEPDGSLAWRVRWDDYRVIEDPESDAAPKLGVAMPFRVHVEQPADDIDTLVRFESIDLNAEVPEDAFVQHPRGGLEVTPIECESP